MNDAVLPSKPATTPPSLTRIVLQILAIIAGIAFGLWALYRIASVVFLLIVTALFAYVIAPLVQLAERPIRIGGRPRRLSRGGAIVVVYVLIAGGVSAGAALLLPTAMQQVCDLISRAPAYVQSILS
jgi:predicted PurR-regulated permease PerM